MYGAFRQLVRLKILVRTGATPSQEELTFLHVVGLAWGRIRARCSGSTGTRSAQSYLLVDVLELKDLRDLVEDVVNVVVAHDRARDAMGTTGTALLEQVALTTNHQLLV